MNLYKYSIVSIILLLGSCQKKAILINPENNPRITHSDSVLKVKFSPDGAYIASGGKDSDIFIWDGHNGNLIKQLKGEYDTVFDIDFLDTKNEIITANYNGNILRWNIQNGRNKSLNLARDFISSLSLNREKDEVVTSTWGNSVKIVSLVNNQIVKECKNGNHRIRSLQYSRKTNSIYAGTAEGNLIQWSYDTCSEKPEAELKTGSDAVTSLDISDSMGILATGSSDRSVTVYELETLKKIKTYKGHKAQVNSVKIISKLGKIASADKDGKIYLWDLKTGDSIVIAAHTDAINTLDVSPDNKYIVSGGSDNLVKLWRISKILSRK